MATNKPNIADILEQTGSQSVAQALRRSGEDSGGSSSNEGSQDRPKMAPAAIEEGETLSEIVNRVNGDLERTVRANRERILQHGESVEEGVRNLPVGFKFDVVNPDEQEVQRELEQRQQSSSEQVESPGPLDNEPDLTEDDDLIKVIKEQQARESIEDQSTGEAEEDALRLDEGTGQQQEEPETMAQSLGIDDELESAAQSVSETLNQSMQFISESIGLSGENEETESETKENVDKVRQKSEELTQKSHQSDEEGFGADKATNLLGDVLKGAVATLGAAASERPFVTGQRLGQKMFGDQQNFERVKKELKLQEQIVGLLNENGVTDPDRRAQLSDQFYQRAFGQKAPDDFTNIVRNSNDDVASKQIAAKKTEAMVAEYTQRLENGEEPRAIFKDMARRVASDPTIPAEMKSEVRDEIKSVHKTLRRDTDDGDTVDLTTFEGRALAAVTGQGVDQNERQSFLREVVNNPERITPEMANSLGYNDKENLLQSARSNLETFEDSKEGPEADSVFGLTNRILKGTEDSPVDINSAIRNIDKLNSNEIDALGFDSKDSLLSELEQKKRENFQSEVDDDEVISRAENSISRGFNNLRIGDTPEDVVNQIRTFRPGLTEEEAQSGNVREKRNQFLKENLSRQRPKAVDYIKDFSNRSDLQNREQAVSDFEKERIETSIEKGNLYESSEAGYEATRAIIDRFQSNRNDAAGYIKSLSKADSINFENNPVLRSVASSKLTEILSKTKLGTIKQEKLNEFSSHIITNLSSGDTPKQARDRAIKESGIARSLNDNG